MSSVVRFLFYLFIIPNIFALITSKPIKHKPLEYPCLPPHHSYPFCNTSLPVKTRAQSLISHLTLSEKVHQLANAAAKIPRLGIPAYQWWSESLHGIATNGKGINFSIGPIFHTVSVPQIVVLAATFNRTLWFKTASAIGIEARAMHNVGQAGLTFWAPNINILRDPRWGRGQETPGEDPMVVSAFGVEYVRGFQHENPKVDETRSNGLMLSACCKHLSAYDLDNWKNYTRYNFNAVITEQDLQDTYHPPFRSCIQQGKASCLMCSYNSINGVPACANKELLQKARRDWGFKGYITADCDAVSSIYETQNYTKTREDAVALALKAGTDIDCKDFMVNYTQSAIEQGKVQEEDVNRALLHLFSVQLRVGLFDGDPTKGPFGKLGPKDVCTAEHKTLALEAARQGIVLLKNDKKFLPQDRNVNSSLAVIGPLANVTALLRGTYRGVSCNPISIFEGLETYAKNITYVAGCLDVRCNSTHGFQEAVSIAKEADSVIVVAGLDKSQEYEYQDRNNLLLPGYQMALVTRIADELFRYNKKPLVLVLVGGGPVDVSFADGDPRIASILWIGYPGEAGGKALAQIIFGDYNPGGRLPFTWYPEEFTRVPMTDMSMRGDPSRGYPGRTYRFYTGDSLYEFGYGLSFTSYTYKLLSVPKKLTLSGPIIAETEKRLDYYIHVDEVASCDSLKFNVQISVMNHGDMDGSNIVLLFSRFPKNFTGAPIKQLVGFDRVQTSPNRSTETSLLVDPCKHLSFADEHGKIILPLGNHTLVLEDVEHIVSIEG